MMRTTARLHANLTTRLNRLEEDSEPICSRQFPSPYHLLVAIDPMHLKYRLCQIYANTHKLNGGPLLSVKWSMTLPVWHLDAVQVRRGPSHCFVENRTTAQGRCPSPPRQRRMAAINVWPPGLAAVTKLKGLH